MFQRWRIVEVIIQKQKSIQDRDLLSWKVGMGWVKYPHEMDLPLHFETYSETCVLRPTLWWDRPLINHFSRSMALHFCIFVPLMKDHLSYKSTYCGWSLITGFTVSWTVAMNDHLKMRNSRWPPVTFRSRSRSLGKWRHPRNVSRYIRL